MSKKIFTISLSKFLWQVKLQYSRKRKNNKDIDQTQGTKIFQYCTCPAGQVTNHLHSSCKHMHLSLKSVCNKEHKRVICNMTYEIPYITAKMIFIQPVSLLHPLY